MKFIFKGLGREFVNNCLQEKRRDWPDARNRILHVVSDVILRIVTRARRVDPGPGPKILNSTGSNRNEQNRMSSEGIYWEIGTNIITFLSIYYEQEWLVGVHKFISRSGQRNCSISSALVPESNFWTLRRHPKGSKRPALLSERAEASAPLMTRRLACYFTFSRQWVNLNIFTNILSFSFRLSL
jgi:hypothetical protein